MKILNTAHKTVIAICYEEKSLPPSCEMIVPDVKAVDSAARDEHHCSKRKKKDLPTV